MNTQVLDRSSYSTTTMSTYQLLAAYIVNIYYNHLYVEGIKMKNDKTSPVTSVTEGYKHSVLAFLSAIDNKSKTYKARHYAQLLTGINQYFTAWTSFSTLTLSDCINKIVIEFVPSDYFASLNKDQLRNILRMVLTNVIREFSKSVIVNFLSGIIDNHKEPANVEALKERMVDLLIMEREGFYNKFLSRSAGKKSETVDKAIAVKMRHEIKRLQKSRTVLAEENKKLKQENTTRVKQLQQLIHKYKLLLTKHKGLIDENTNLKEAAAEPSEYRYEEPVRHYNPPSRFVEPTRFDDDGQSLVDASSLNIVDEQLDEQSIEPIEVKPKKKKKSKSKSNDTEEKQSAREIRALARKKRREAKEAAKIELERAERERDAELEADAKKEAAEKLANRLKSATETTTRANQEMGETPSISDVY